MAVSAALARPLPVSSQADLDQLELPAPLARSVLLATCALVAALAAWSAFARLDIVATAEGRIVPRGYTKVVQPAQGGVVSAVAVKEGDTVREGQVLLTLDERIAVADTQSLAGELSLQRLAMRRIEAELQDRPLVRQESDPAEGLARAQAQLVARRDALRDSLAQETSVLNRAHADLAAAQQTQAKLSQTLPLTRQAADAYRKLVAEGFAGELMAADRQREVIANERDLDAQAATMVSLQATIAQAKARIAGLRSQYRSQLEGERLEAAKAINRLEQELDKSRTRASMLEIRAPHSGVVKDLQFATRGAVVEPGAVLLSVVPNGEPLQVEVALRNEDVGFVATGQSAKLKVAAFPFQKYGLLEGQVSLLGADTSVPRGAENQPPTYRALIQLAGDKLSGPSNASLPLTPGMHVTAEIHQGRRTVLEYLLSSVTKVTHEAARER